MECEIDGEKGYKWGHSGTCYRDRADAEKQAAAAHANGYTGDVELAADATARSYDKDGHLRISKSHISKATVNPYYGSEIPGYEKLGLDPGRVYYMFRDPIELARAASTFAGKPILSRHVPISATEHRPDLVVGSIGSNVEFNDPYLDADLTFWDATAIAGIETEAVRELSCAYRYTPDMTPGEYHGQRYDGVMREIIGNHLAQVEAGRAGSDVMAADEDPMKKTTKLGKALILTLGGMSPKLAQDSALPALVGKASKKTLNVGEVSAKLIALDADLDPNKLKASIDALLALDAEPKEKPAADDDMDDEDDDTAEDEDESEEDKKKRLAKDAEKEEKDKKAMDAAIKSGVASVRAQIREANEAARAVRDVVGDVVTQDSAEEIYAFALDEMKVDHKGVSGVPALRALFNAVNSARSAAPVAVAMDSAGLASQFPELSRLRSV